MARGYAARTLPWSRQMIKVSVMYPYREGARFDHAYYRDQHMPLVSARMGPACLKYTVDKGISGGEAGSPPAFIGMCHIFCASQEAFNASFGPHAAEILGDIANYTDLTPVMQISEVMVG
ncbi:ethyl tert-butyl ether degradation protein EthD [Xanthomonas perforans]|nr:ethyl tert-butyl ether degradation protein EthD [Xanthomonas perforans]